MLVLRPAIHFPPADHVERLAIHDEDAGWSVCPIGAAAAQRGDVNSLWSAMDRVRTRIAGFAEDLLRLDDLNDLRFGRARLGVDDVDPRRSDAGDDQIATFKERMARQRE